MQWYFLYRSISGSIPSPERDVYVRHSHIGHAMLRRSQSLLCFWMAKTLPALQLDSSATAMPEETDRISKIFDSQGDRKSLKLSIMLSRLRRFEHLSKKSQAHTLTYKQPHATLSVTLPAFDDLQCWTSLFLSLQLHHIACYCARTMST